MFFKTLTIQGFKSFADKTVLQFDAKTTAVVGSNGNGKSNISDALRWVMGEQGAKTLRGEKMEDVIFHGTTERKPMGFAKVTLLIDNGDRALGIDANEVEISRKLYRTGESEYLINGKKSRLRDIQELLMGTGLGRDGYSIVGQGRVAEIVNARGSERREIFEEAAGVSLFLHKKADAEKQLAAAEENIVRQRDLIRVDEERLPVLKKQSEKAALASELMAQKKELEISVSAARLKEKRESLIKIDDDLLLNRAQYENFERDIENADNEIERLGDDKLAANARLSRIRAGIQNANDELSDKRAEISVAENDLKHNAERRAELTEQLEKAERNSRAFDERIEEIKAQIERKIAEAKDFDEQIKAREKELSEISERSSERGAEYSAIESAMAKAYGRKTELSLMKTQSERACTEAAEQKTEFLQSVSDSEKTMNAYKTELDGAEKRLCEIADEKQTAANRLAGTERLSEGKRKRLDEARKAFEDAQRALGEKQQRHKVLSDIEKSREGYSRAVKEVIGASEQGRLAGIHGTVADVVSVPKKYVTAIETALGSVMQNIIVDNEETATRCIRFLKETNSGRATFYPLTSMKGRTLNEPRLVSEEGFEGIASELVSFDGEYANIINYLLGLTAVVDDIDAATVIGKKYGYKFRIVTLDGQVVNSGGSFTGGSRISGSGIISRKQELDALLSDIEKLRDTVKTRSEEFERYRAEYAKFSIEAEGMQDKIRSLEQDEIRGTAEKSRLTGLIEQLVSQSATARQTLNRFEAQIAQQRDIIANAEKEIGVLDGEIAELEKKHAEQTGERTKAENKLKAISDGINALNLEKMAAQKDADALSAQIKSINDDRRTLLENSGGYKSAMETLDNSDREIREKIVRLNIEIEKSSASLTEQNDEIESVSRSITELDGKITELRRDIDEANKNKQKFSSELARLEERRGTLQKEYDKIVSLLMDSYEMTVSQAEREAKIPENLLVAENDLAELNKRISSLGIVNMASIEEYETVSKRYEFQSAQLRDIENAKHGLEKLIEQLTGDIKTRFLASFEDINKHFKEIFVQIFGAGSHAELELTNPEDLLNSGIEIKAAPPGKVIKNLISLSGGEQTMVAITIYFAILMHRPTPFCMLDEVDAALDDINVEKYIRYLNQFSKSTQLMVITHRRGTIEGCSVLYGVFMQEKGVSRLLRQELSEELSDELNDIID